MGTLSQLVKGSYGQVVVLTIEEDSSAKDISGFTTTLQAILKGPDGAISAKTCAFTTDGTDGKMQFTIADGDISQKGEWTIQARIVSGTQDIRTVPESFTVEEKVE